MAAVHPIIAQLTKIRRGCGSTHKDVTDAAGGGISRQALSYLEAGRRQPRLDTVTVWAAALGYRLTLEPIQNGDTGQ